MEDCISFVLAKKLKEKGFIEKCLCHYIGNDLVYNIESPISNNQLWFSHNQFDNIWHRDNIDAPTISQILKWLREKSIFILPVLGCVSHNTQHFQVKVIVKNDYPLQRILDNDGEDYTTYEESALAGIEYILNNNII